MFSTGTKSPTSNPWDQRLFRIWGWGGGFWNDNTETVYKVEN